MNKTIFTVILITIGFISLMLWARSIQEPIGLDIGAGSVLSVSEKLYDFGTISMKNGDVVKEFVVTNPTDKDIVVNSLVTSCMCTKAFVVGPNGAIKGPFGMPGMGYAPAINEAIKAGEDRVIRVVYDPNAHGPAGVGRINRYVTLADKSGGKLQLEIKAVVTP